MRRNLTKISPERGKSGNLIGIVQKEAAKQKIHNNNNKTGFCLRKSKITTIWRSFFVDPRVFLRVKKCSNLRYFWAWFPRPHHVHVFSNPLDRCHLALSGLCYVRSVFSLFQDDFATKSLNWTMSNLVFFRNSWSATACCSQKLKMETCEMRCRASWNPLDWIHGSIS